MFQIEKGVPLVMPRRTGRKPRYPWADMEVGDCFKVSDRTAFAMRNTARNAAERHGHRYKISEIDGVAHVWRVA